MGRGTIELTILEIEGIYTVDVMHPQVSSGDTISWAGPESSCITLLFPHYDLFGMHSMDIPVGATVALAIQTGNVESKSYEYSIYVHQTQQLIKNGGEPDIEITG